VVELDGRRWFRTGDLAMVDEEGYFFIRGRKKDMIIVGGENVYAVEVEAFLMTHDQVEEAAVKGVPATGAASFLGEQIEAYVVRFNPALTAQELRRYCLEHLASYKVPLRVVFVTGCRGTRRGRWSKTTCILPGRVVVWARRRDGHVTHG